MLKRNKQNQTLTDCGRLIKFHLHSFTLSETVKSYNQFETSQCLSWIFLIHV